MAGPNSEAHRLTPDNISANLRQRVDAIIGLRTTNPRKFAAWAIEGVNVLREAARIARADIESTAENGEALDGKIFAAQLPFYHEANRLLVGVVSLFREQETSESATTDLRVSFKSFGNSPEHPPRVGFISVEDEGKEFSVEFNFSNFGGPQGAEVIRTLASLQGRRLVAVERTQELIEESVFEQADPSELAVNTMVQLDHLSRLIQAAKDIGDQTELPEVMVASIKTRNMLIQARGTLARQLLEVMEAGTIDSNVPLPSLQGPDIEGDTTTLLLNALEMNHDVNGVRVRFTIPLTEIYRDTSERQEKITKARQARNGESRR